MRVGTWVIVGRGGIAAMLAAALGLGACGAPQRGTWTKEGLTEDELRRDQKECVAEADSYSFLSSPPVLGGGPSAATRQQGDIYRACMARKGYGEVSSGASPQPGATQPAQ